MSALGARHTDRASQISEKHGELEKGYVDILKACSWLPLISKYEVWHLPKERSKFRNPVAWRGLIRIFVEAHMKRVLVSARRFLVLEAQVASSVDDRAEFQFLAQESEDLLSQLRSVPGIRAFFAVGWPIFLALIPAFRGFSLVRSHLFVSISALLAFAYVTLPLRHSFIHTREVFFPGVTVAEMWAMRSEAELFGGTRGAPDLFLYSPKPPDLLGWI
jgi:hypothetical protein